MPGNVEAIHIYASYYVSTWCIALTSFEDAIAFILIIYF